jgi:medium-chain acyl-[acyl-carrier-protein] hydrolase
LYEIANGRQRVSSWLRYFYPDPRASLRLFCFSYAGGTSGIFRLWPEHLPPSVELGAVELPGRGPRLREAAYSRLPDLVAAVAEALRPCFDKPFAFFGHSMGTLVSFELTRYLRRWYGLEPVHLFVSAGRAPQLPDPNRPIHTLPDSAFLEELRHLNGTPAAVLDNAEMMGLLLPSLKADFAVCETYIYAVEPPLSCSITAFGGLQDRVVSRDDLKAWRDQTRASFALRMLPGDHFFLHTARSLLLRTLSEELVQSAGMDARGQGP